MMHPDEQAEWSDKVDKAIGYIYDRNPILEQLYDFLSQYEPDAAFVVEEWLENQAIELLQSE